MVTADEVGMKNRNPAAVSVSDLGQWLCVLSFRIVCYYIFYIYMLYLLDCQWVSNHPALYSICMFSRGWGFPI